MAGTDDFIAGWIRQAEKTGEMKTLPGYGKPLDLEDDSHIPSEYRMTYKILKNAGIVPPEVEMIKELSNLKQELEQQTDDTARQTLVKRIREAQLELDVALDKFRNAR